MLQHDPELAASDERQKANISEMVDCYQFHFAIVKNLLERVNAPNVLISC